MVCIYCAHETSVVNSRLQRRINQTWRRRKCQNCGATFTTHEAAAYESSVAVKTAKGKLIPFTRDKLFVGLLKSCQHRSTAVNDASALTNTVISKLLPEVRDGILPISNIIAATESVLQHFDKAAAVHYHAYHPL
jgi:transcriptional regulator NrdR family protein